MPLDDPFLQVTLPTVLGLRENWRQFWLLVLINAFVGTMVGLERTVLPLLAEAGDRIGRSIDRGHGYSGCGTDAGNTPQRLGADAERRRVG